MNSNFKTPILSLSAALILGMTGCSIVPDDETVVEESTAIAEVSTIDGVAVDGYLKYSTVCLDLNSDSFCQPTEPFTLTDADGSFSLSLTKAQKNNAGYRSAQLVVYGGQDSDRPGEDFIGKLKAPNDGTGKVNVTPVTTLVSAYIQKEGVSDVSVEDIESAKTKVATSLGITEDQVSADPRASNDAELMNATLQLQYAVSTMVKAASSTDSDADVAGDIFAAFATGLDNAGVNTDVAAGVAAIIANADATKLDAIDNNLKNVKEVAKAAATNVNTAMTAGTLDVTDVDSLNAALTQVVVYQAKVSKALETTDFSDSVAATAFDYSAATINFAEESAKIYLEDLGVNTTDLNMTEYATKVSFDQDLEALALTLATDTAIVAQIQTKITANETVVTQIQSDVADAAATADGASKMAALEADVTALLTPTATADVADAKNLVTQIRESVTSFIDVDALNVEDNTSTILGSQVSLITSKIQPAVEDIASDFNVSASALDASLTAFGSSLESDFADVLGTDTTKGTLGDRLYAIDLATMDQNNSTNWTATAGTDTITHTYAKDATTNVVTETLKLNNDTLTMSYEDAEDGKLISATTSGAISFTGTGYDLSLTTLSFVNNKAELKASGTITGTNGATMTLTALDLSVDLDETKMDTAHMFNNIEATFDGTIVAGGRTVAGKLVVSESDNTKNQIIGSYTGTSTEPSFIGTITANLSLDDFKTVEEDKNWGINSDTLLMVTYAADGNKSFVESYERKYPQTNILTNNYEFYDKLSGDLVGSMTQYEIDQNGLILSELEADYDITIIEVDTGAISTDYSNPYYLLNTQDDRNITCTTTTNSINDAVNNIYGYSHSVNCEGGSVKAYYGDNKVISLTIDGANYVVRGAWYDWNNNLRIDLQNGEIYSNNGTLYLDTYGDNAGEQAAIISAVSIRDAVSMDEMDMDLTFTGTLTHGAKVITATAGLRQAGTSISSTMYAENVSITDGTSFIKIAELSATAAKSGMFSNDEDDYYSNYGYSAFENYSIDYNDYYGYEDNGPEFSSVTVNDFNVSITDADGNALTFDADVSYEKNAFGTETIAFNGTYEYAQTKFVGIVDVSMNDNAKTNSFSVSGDVESNGFEPFSIATAGSMLGEEMNAYGLFTRGTNYKLGLSVTTDSSVSTEKVMNISMADSNGVVLVFENNESEAVEGSPLTITFTDKDGTSLATMGEDATGNSWEITYSDDKTETIF